MAAGHYTFLGATTKAKNADAYPGGYDPIASRLELMVNQLGVERRSTLFNTGTYIKIRRADTVSEVGVR